MNTNPPTPKPTNGTFIFQCVVQFEIDPETATNLLVESDPTQTVHDWLLTQHPAREDHSWRGNTDNLRGALGSYLTDNAISKARLLLPSGDPTAPPF